ncbi:hypothetical protein ACMHYB_15120 [Sorangium sp. So ce1128]
MTAKMRFVEAEDSSCVLFPVGDYVEDLVKRLQLPTTRKKIGVRAVYMNDEKHLCYVLLNWRRKNVFLVVVARSADKDVYGCRMLDLSREYGIGGPDA